jgi:biotin synthase
MDMSDEMHALCFIAGANSVFAGEKLLTTPNPGDDHDATLLERLGMHYRATNEKGTARCPDEMAA